MATQVKTLPLTHALEHLRDELAGLELGLDVPAAGEARRLRGELVAQVDDYLVPRLRRMDAPLLLVVGGSTGAGKSTLVNSLVGEDLSPAGVLRPTTRAPVLVCHPDDLRWFEDDRILPGLARNSGGAPRAGGVHLVPTERVGRDVALLDAPDIDSVVTANRELATQLLAAADVWLFVTTAARYADAVPWDLLHAARDRGTSLSLVLDRVPPDAAEVAVHLREMLADRDLAETPLLVVPEAPLAAGLLPPEALSPVREWLDLLFADAGVRADLVRRTLMGALASLPARVETVAATVSDQVTLAKDLRAEVDRAYGDALAEVDEAMRSGTLLHGEVLARWHDVVGTGELMRALESRVAWARDRLRSLVTGAPTAQAELRSAVETGVESLVHAAADRAAERSAHAWRQRVTGRALLAPTSRLDAASAGLRDRAAHEVRAWQTGVVELVRAEGASRRTTARIASLGVNGAGLTVMLAVFASTGGLTGAEIAVAGGTSALSQKVLEAVFGDQAVRRLADRAREDLLARVEGVLADEAERFGALLDPLVPAPDAAERLRRALGELDRAQ